MTASISLKAAAMAALAPIALDMAQVNARIKKELDSDIPAINEISDYIISAGGKRMRPAILLLVAKALGYEGPLAVQLATVLEFVHTATLLHDDVVDESDMRRGKPTANAVWGNALSVLVGDFLWSRAVEMITDAGNLRAIAVLAKATNILSEGEVLQQLNMHDVSLTEERYYAVIERKTAVLFEAGCRMAAIIAGASQEVEEACSRYGQQLGRAFQIIDDVLDYSGKAADIGKTLGDDLREGKVTLPLIYALRRTSPENRQVIAEAVKAGHGDFERISQIVRESGALEECIETAERERAAGEKALDRIPACKAKDSLIKLLALTVRRDR